MAPVSDQINENGVTATNFGSPSLPEERGMAATRGKAGQSSAYPLEIRWQIALTASNKGTP
jgi:hypothetical protein